MSTTYDLDCVWATHEGILRNDETRGAWQGRIICDEYGFFNGILREPNEEGFVITHYIVGMFDEEEDMSFMKMSLIQNTTTEEYNLSIDRAGGFSGTIQALSPIPCTERVSQVEVAGARIRAKKVELTPEEFNNTQKQIEDAKEYMIKNPFARSISEFIEDSYNMMKSVAKNLTEAITNLYGQGKE